MKRNVGIALAVLGLGYLVFGADLFGFRQHNPEAAEPALVERLPVQTSDAAPTQAAPRAAPTSAARAAPARSALSVPVPTPGAPPAMSITNPPLRREAFVLISPAVLSGPMPVNATGEGFLAQELIAVVLLREGETRGMELDDVFADRDGRIPGATVQLPEALDPGRYELVFQGTKSGRVLRGRLQIAPSLPWVQFDAPGLTPYEPFDLSGGNFTPGEEIRVYLDGLSGEPFATFRADGYGKLRAAGVQPPLASEGNHFLIVVGTQSRTPTRIPVFALGFHPWVTLDDYAPRPQTTIGLVGHGFAPGETIQVYFNDRKTPVAEITADDKGEAEGHRLFELPVTATAENQVILVGATSQVGADATFTVQPFGPALELTLYAGRAGRKVAFVGSGWAKAEPLRVYVGKPKDGREVSRFESDPGGAFRNAGEFQIPYDVKTGQLPVTVVGEQSKAEVTIEFTVLAIEPYAELSRSVGPPGKSITLAAHAFAAGEQVSVHLNDRGGELVARGEATVDGDLPAVGPFQIPADARDGDKVTFVFVGEQSGAEARQVYQVQIGEPPAGPGGSRQ